MSNKNAKLIRGQVRQIVQEVLTQELVDALYKKLNDDMSKVLRGMEANAKVALEKLNENQKDMQNNLTRVLSQLTPVAPKALEPTPSE